MIARKSSCRLAIFLVTTLSVSVAAHAGQKELQRLTVGYTPVSGASIPFFIAVEEKIFQKYGFEVSPVFMGGSPGNFPLAIPEGAR